MTAQLLSRVSPETNSVKSFSRVSQPSAANQGVNQQVEVESLPSADVRLRQQMQSYQVLHQVEYLHLQAEIDVLLQQLQTLKQQKRGKTVNYTLGG